MVVSNFPRDPHPSLNAISMTTEEAAIAVELPPKAARSPQLLTYQGSALSQIEQSALYRSCRCMIPKPHTVR